MVNKISFENYKAFEKGSLDIKPITVLLGANSVGKSSIMQLMLMLQQTATTDRHKSALRLHGEYISMGSNANIFKDFDTSKELTLSFEFTSEKLLDDITSKYYRYLETSILQSNSILKNYKKHHAKIKSQKVNERFIFHYDVGNNRGKKIKSKETFNNILESIKQTQDFLLEKDVYPDQQWQYRYDVQYFIDRKSRLTKQKIFNYVKLFNYLKSIEKLNNNKFIIKFRISNFTIGKEEVLKVTNVKLLNSGKVVLELNLDVDFINGGYKNFELRTDFLRVNNLLNKDVKEEFLSLIKFDSTIFNFIRAMDYEYHYPRFGNSGFYLSVYSSILFNAIQNVNKSFGQEKINYVSPLRAHPKRYYFLDKANITTVLDTLDGNSLTETLKENSIIRKKVNDWLTKFNLSVDVSTLQDVIHNLKIRQHGLDLDITDVGFGISQVLPVIVQGFLTENDSVTIIEQPEIHLHPKMQADLADLFIDIAVGFRRLKFPQKFLLIETHSEYLLKRLRRRIAENEKISSDSVAIYYFHPRTDINSGYIEKKDISKSGFFEYPRDFYSGELLTDNIEFIKRQIK